MYPYSHTYLKSLKNKFDAIYSFWIYIYFYLYGFSAHIR